MIAIVAMTAREPAAAMARRELACVEVIDAFLDQIETCNPGANAMVGLRARDDLRVEARAKDRQVAGGSPLGALAGLPLALKDLVEAIGIRTTTGSLVLRGHVPVNEGIMAERVRIWACRGDGKRTTRARWAAAQADESRRDTVVPSL